MHAVDTSETSHNIPPRSLFHPECFSTSGSTDSRFGAQGLPPSPVRPSAFLVHITISPSSCLFPPTFQPHAIVFFFAACGDSHFSTLTLILRSLSRHSFFGSLFPSSVPPSPTCASLLWVVYPLLTSMCLLINFPPRRHPAQFLFSRFSKLHFFNT